MIGYDNGDSCWVKVKLAEHKLDGILAYLAEFESVEQDVCIKEIFDNIKLRIDSISHMFGNENSLDISEQWNNTEDKPIRYLDKLPVMA